MRRIAVIAVSDTTLWYEQNARFSSVETTIWVVADDGSQGDAPVVLARRAAAPTGRSKAIELYVDDNDALCCPTFERTSYFRLDAKLKRYVRFRTHVRRLPNVG